MLTSQIKSVLMTQLHAFKSVSISNLTTSRLECCCIWNNWQLHQSQQLSQRHLLASPKGDQSDQRTSPQSAYLQLLSMWMALLEQENVETMAKLLINKYFLPFSISSLSFPEYISGINNNNGVEGGNIGSRFLFFLSQS
jgi:hypothetical protein